MFYLFGKKIIFFHMIAIVSILILALFNDVTLIEN